MALDPTLDDRIPSPEMTGVSEVSVGYDEFTTTRQIGTGGSATVHEATVSDGPVDRIAVKTPDWEHTVTRSAVTSFVEEAERWARVDDHPHVATVFGSGSDPQPWIAIEYLDGGPLADCLPVDDPLEALWIGSTVAEALQHAHHRGVAHRDLTPSNVLLDESNGEDEQWGRPVVVDWGLATALDGGDDPDGFTIGYAAPEQRATDGRSVGPLTDVYQLGALVYALLTGRPPDLVSDSDSACDTPVTPPSELRRSLPAAVDRVVLDALALRPADRTQTAAQFGEACANCFSTLVDRNARTSGTVGESTAVSPAESRRDSRSTGSGGSDDVPGSTGVDRGSTAPTAERTTADRNESENRVDTDDRTETGDTGDTEGWFVPETFPTADRRSLAAALRSVGDDTETGDATDDDERSLAAALRSGATKAGQDTLAARIRDIHTADTER